MKHGAGPQRARAFFRVPGLLMLLVLLLACAVRFHRLDAQSFWYDEGVAYTHATRNLPELIPLLQRNVHVPAYFGLLGIWEDLAGASEFSLRALSAFFSIVSVGLTFALGARLFNPIAGLAAAAIVALNSFSIYYAQEARMYAMMSAIAGGSMWLFITLLRKGGAGRKRLALLLALGTINALGMYTHVVYALVILAQVALATLWLADLGLDEWRRTRSARKALRLLSTYLLANLLTLLLFSPWIPTALSQVFSQPNLAQPLPLEQILRQIQGFFAFGITYELGMGNMAVVVYFFLLFGLLLPDSRKCAWWKMLLPPIWVLVSVLLYLYLDLGDRYLRFLLPAQMAFALWLGRGVWILWTRKTRERHPALRPIPKLAAIVALLAYLLTLADGLPILYQHSDFQRDDVRGLVARIEAELREGDAVLVSAAGFEEVLRYYYHAEAPVYGLPTSADDKVTRAQVGDIIDSHERLHVIFYGAAEQDASGIVETTLNNQAYEISDEWVGDLLYLRYVRPAAFQRMQAVDQRFGDNIFLRSFALSAQDIQPGDLLQAQLIWTADERPSIRYKVFLHLLNADGLLIAQRDTEPAGGVAMTISWQPEMPVIDNHGLQIPGDLPAGEYRLTVGLYDINDPNARLAVDEGTYLELARIRVGQPVSR